jgi:hypothetical protein
MFYMQEKLVESIHQDRHREAEAARLNTVPGTSSASRGRLLSVPQLITNAVRRARSVAPANVA